MKLCIYEDARYRRLLPLVWLNPVYFLRCGMTSLAEKITAAFPGMPVSYHCRAYLTDTVAEGCAFPVNRFERDRYVLVNGRALFTAAAARRIDTEKPDCLYVSDGDDIAAVLSPESAAALHAVSGKPLHLRELFPGFPRETVDAAVIRYPWDLIAHNERAIRDDFARLCAAPAVKGKLYEGARILNAGNVQVGAGAAVKPGAVIDAEKGPVCIDDGATVMPHAFIEGPAYVGSRSVIKAGAKIYEGTSIGEVCKVGGEVESTIIHAYSNKQHDGFLGHAYIGQWVNLGADTNNSDLKNNYKTVRMTIDGEETDTGLTFMGLVMGDHSKSGINTMFNTGTVIGVHCNVFGGGFPPKYIPSFSWGGAGGFTAYDVDRAVETARIVMARRKMELSDALCRLYRLTFDWTAEERARFFG